MKVVIVAGGKGTRLGLPDIPKPMVPIDGRPLLAHQVKLACDFGVDEIIILSGFRAQSIIDYFGDGSDFGVKISHIVEDVPLGPAGAVRQLYGQIHERFMVFYGDVFMDFDLRSFVDFDKMEKSIATIIVHPNDHPHDSDLVAIDGNGFVTDFYPKPHGDSTCLRNLVNAAVYILDPGIFQYIPKHKLSDFGQDVFPELIANNQKVRAYNTSEYIKDLGTRDRLEKVTRDYSTGKVSRWSKRNKRPAIFIDRDGTLIKKIHLLHRVEDVELFFFSAEAILKLNKTDYLAFLVTNQPVVARNLCTLEDVEKVHWKLESLLGKHGAYLNNIYFCPHHPDKGYPEENLEFKIACDCRKPGTGMIERAQEEYNIDMEASWIIGDSTLDIQAGRNAGMKTILVKTGDAGEDSKYFVEPDFVADTILDAVELILLQVKQK